jgi:hypothetical protein
MIMQNLKNGNMLASKNLIVEAELDSENLILEEYDQQQVESRIQTKDYQIELLNSVGQTSILIGMQTISIQYLLSVGSVGLYPVAVSLLPVVGSVLATLTNFNFNGGIQIENKYKFPGQVLRTAALGTNATKLILDAKEMDDIAAKSFQVIVKQEREYLSLPEPQKLDLVLPGMVFLVVLLAALARKRK